MALDLTIDQLLFFFSLSPDLLAILGEDGRFLEANPAWENLLGFKPNELQQSSFLELVHGPDQSLTQMEIHKLLKGQKTLSFESRLLHKNQSIRWIQWTWHHLKDEQCFYLNGKDITRLKETEKALEENQAKFKRLSDSAKEGIAIHDKGIVLEANQAMANMMGYKNPEELVSLDGLDFPAPEYRALVRENIAKGFEQPYEAVFQRKDGSRFDGMICGKPIQYQGRTMRVTTLLDISPIKKGEQELFESKELFQKLAEASKDGIAVSDRGKILLANPALAQMFGYGVSEMVGRNAVEFAATEFRETLLKKVLSEVETPYEMMGLKKDGSRFPLEITGRMTSYQGRRVRVAFFRDITQRKKIEEEVQRQKDFSQNLINSSIDGFLAFDQECRYTLWNPAMERISGHTREEVLGHTAFEVFPFLKQIGEDQYFYKALEGKTSFSRERPYRTPAGRQGFFEAYYMPIKNTQGQIIGGLGIIHDVTERKKTEEALKQSELNLKAVFNNTLQNIVLLDLEGRIVDLNSNAISFLHEVSGVNAEKGNNFFKYVFPAHVKDAKERFQKALQGEVAFVERTIPLKDGSNHWHEISYNPVFGEMGEIEGVCFTCNNTDDRKNTQKSLEESEEKFRKIFENAQMGMTLVDKNFHFAHVNQSFCDFLGYTNKELIGRTFKEITYPDDIDQNVALAEGLTKNKNFRMQKRYLHKNGSVLWANLFVTAFFDPKGELLYSLGMIEDITQRKTAEEALKTSEEKFRRIFEDASTAMAMVSDYRFIKVNKAFQELLGYSGEEITGKTLFEITHPDDLSKTKVIANAVHDGKKENFKSEKRYLRKDGQSLWANVSGTVIRDESGMKLYSLIMIENISDQKKAQEALRKSEADLRAVFDSRSEVAILINRDGRIKGFNKSAAGMAPRILGRGIEPGMLFAETLPPGASLKIFQESFAFALEGKETKGERSIVAPDGKERWVEVNYQPVFNDEGGVEGVCFSLTFIDGRKKAERDLLESQERFERLAQVTQEGVLLHDNPNVLDANQALADMLGYTTDEMIGKSGFDFLAPESHESARRNMRESSSAPYEALALRKDGTTLPVELQGRNFQYKGKELRVLSVRDLTWQKEAERILTESEDRYRRLVEVSPEAVIVHAGGKVLYVNPTGVEMFGAGGKKVEGQSILEFLHPESREMAMARVQQIMETGKATEWVEQKLVRLNGEEFMAETKGIPFLYKGTPSVLTIARDITDRKKVEKALRESEEHYRRLVEEIPLAIMLVGEGMRVVSANAEAAKVFKAGRPEDLLGKSVLDFVLPENRQIVEERVWGTLNEGADAPTRETELLALNGERIQVEVSAMPLTYQGRQCALSLFRDISERKKNQQTLLRYERLAAVGKVIAGLAHEIRNPLAVVSGMSQILKSKLESRSEYSQELSTILNQTDRLKLYMNDILDYSREMEIKKGKVDVQNLLEKSLVVVQAQIGPPHVNIQVKRQWSKNLPELWVDGERLEQVMVNLILNAYQCMNEKGTLTLSCGQKGEALFLGVEDDGPGISESDLPRLFEPFFTTKKHGSGLGLSISKKIVEAHGGKIEVQRILPHGTLFTLQLPIQKT